MKPIATLLPHVSLAMVLALLGVSAAAADGAIDAAQAFRNACGPCHSSNLGHRIGPSLVGIDGRISGTAAGFEYSQAMRKAALRWDAATLDRFLTKPGAVVPGTTMTYPGLKDEARRQAIIEYIAGLRATVGSDR